MEKLFIKNRKGQKVCVLVEQVRSHKDLAFVMHGLSGFKEQAHIATFAQAFKERGCTVVRFDTTHTFGESDGEYADATVTNYYEDLEDVIAWARTQTEWYHEPFFLAGHSLGGICTALYAQAYPSNVKGLAPISTVISGQLSLQTASYEAQKAALWEQTGWIEKESETVPGRIKRLKWSHMEDRLKYDLLPDAYKLTMPVLLIVGDRDGGTPLKHQQLLFNALPGKKELHIITGAPHTFYEQQHLDQIKQIFFTWIEKVQNSFR